MQAAYWATTRAKAEVSLSGPAARRGGAAAAHARCSAPRGPAAEGSHGGGRAGPVRAVPAPGPGPGRRGAAGGGRSAGAAGARVPRADLDGALRPRALLRGDAAPGCTRRRGLAAAQPGWSRPRALRRTAHALCGAVRAAPRPAARHLRLRPGAGRGRGRG